MASSRSPDPGLLIPRPRRLPAPLPAHEPFELRDPRPEFHDEPVDDDLRIIDQHVDDGRHGGLDPGGSSLTASFGNGGGPGLVITNGSLTNLDVTASGTFSMLGLTYHDDHPVGNVRHVRERLPLRRECGRQLGGPDGRLVGLPGPQRRLGHARLGPGDPAVFPATAW